MEMQQQRRAVALSTPSQQQQTGVQPQLPHSRSSLQQHSVNTRNGLQWLQRLQLPQVAALQCCEWTAEVFPPQVSSDQAVLLLLKTKAISLAPHEVPDHVASLVGIDTQTEKRLCQFCRARKQHQDTAAQASDSLPSNDESLQASSVCSCRPHQLLSLNCACLTERSVPCEMLLLHFALQQRKPQPGPKTAASAVSLSPRAEGEAEASAVRAEKDEESASNNNSNNNHRASTPSLLSFSPSPLEVALSPLVVSEEEDDPGECGAGAESQLRVGVLQIYARRFPDNERQVVAALPLDGAGIAAESARVAARKNAFSCVCLCTACCGQAVGDSRREAGEVKSVHPCSCTAKTWFCLSACGSVLARVNCAGVAVELLCCLMHLPIVEFRIRCRVSRDRNALLRNDVNKAKKGSDSEEDAKQQKQQQKQQQLNAERSSFSSLSSEATPTSDFLEKVLFLSRRLKAAARILRKRRVPCPCIRLLPGVALCTLADFFARSFAAEASHFSVSSSAKHQAPPAGSGECSSPPAARLAAEIMRQNTEERVAFPPRGVARLCGEAESGRLSNNRTVCLGSVGGGRQQAAVSCAGDDEWQKPKHRNHHHHHHHHHQQQQQQQQQQGATARSRPWPSRRVCRKEGGGRALVGGTRVCSAEANEGRREDGEGEDGQDEEAKEREKEEGGDEEEPSSCEEEEEDDEEQGRLSVKEFVSPTDPTSLVSEGGGPFPGVNSLQQSQQIPLHPATAVHPAFAPWTLPAAINPTLLAQPLVPSASVNWAPAFCGPLVSASPQTMQGEDEGAGALKDPRSTSASASMRRTSACRRKHRTHLGTAVTTDSPTSSHPDPRRNGVFASSHSANNNNSNMSHRRHIAPLAADSRMQDESGPKVFHSPCPTQPYYVVMQPPHGYVHFFWQQHVWQQHLMQQQFFEQSQRYEALAAASLNPFRRHPPLWISTASSHPSTHPSHHLPPSFSALQPTQPPPPPLQPLQSQRVYRGTGLQPTAASSDRQTSDAPFKLHSHSGRKRNEESSGAQSDRGSLPSSVPSSQTAGSAGEVGGTWLPHSIGTSAEEASCLSAPFAASHFPAVSAAPFYRRRHLASDGFAFASVSPHLLVPPHRHARGRRVGRAFYAGGGVGGRGVGGSRRGGRGGSSNNSDADSALNEGERARLHYLSEGQTESNFSEFSPQSARSSCASKDWWRAGRATRRFGSRPFDSSRATSPSDARGRRGQRVIHQRSHSDLTFSSRRNASGRTASAEALEEENSVRFSWETRSASKQGSVRESSALPAAQTSRPSRLSAPKKDRLSFGLSTSRSSRVRADEEDEDKEEEDDEAPCSEASSASSSSSSSSSASSLSSSSPVPDSEEGGDAASRGSTSPRGRTGGVSFGASFDNGEKPSAEWDSVPVAASSSSSLGVPGLAVSQLSEEVTPVYFAGTAGTHGGGVSSASAFSAPPWFCVQQPSQQQSPSLPLQVALQQPQREASCVSGAVQSTFPPPFQQAQLLQIQQTQQLDQLQLQSQQQQPQPLPLLQTAGTGGAFTSRGGPALSVIAVPQVSTPELYAATATTPFANTCGVSVRCGFPVFCVWPTVRENCEVTIHPDWQKSSARDARSSHLSNNVPATPTTSKNDNPDAEEATPRTAQNIAGGPSCADKLPQQQCGEEGGKGAERREGGKEEEGESVETSEKHALGAARIEETNVAASMEDRLAVTEQETKTASQKEKLVSDWASVVSRGLSPRSRRQMNSRVFVSGEAEDASAVKEIQKETRTVGVAQEGSCDESDKWGNVASPATRQAEEGPREEGAARCESRKAEENDGSANAHLEVATETKNAFSEGTSEDLSGHKVSEALRKRLPSGCNQGLTSDDMKQQTSAESQEDASVGGSPDNAAVPPQRVQSVESESRHSGRTDTRSPSALHRISSDRGEDGAKEEGVPALQTDSSVVVAGTAFALKEESENCEVGNRHAEGGAAKSAEVEKFVSMENQAVSCQQAGGSSSSPFNALATNMHSVSLVENHLLPRGMHREAFNLQSFLIATTPAAQFPLSPESDSSAPTVCQKDRVGDNSASHSKEQAYSESSVQESRDSNPVFLLSDLWRAFDIASTFGIEVPLLNENLEPTYVVYVPYLSAVHLFPKQQKRDEQQEADSALEEGDANARGGSFRFTEVRLPYQRRPLYQQIALLLQGVEVAQSQSLPLLVSSSEELSDDSWLCIHWQAMQREYARVPAPSFLIYYRFQAEPASNHPSSEGAAVRAPQYLSSDTSANDRQTKNCVEETREMAKAEISGLLQQQQAFATLVRFAVVPGKGVGEWLATDAGEKAAFAAEVKRVEDWLRALQVNHPDLNSFKRNAI